MFDLVTKYKRVTQILLALIALPFAFFGVDYYYRRVAATPEIAQVGDHKITQQEFADALREQQDRMRQAMGRNFDPAFFDSPEVRYSILEQLVNERLLAEKASDEHFRVTDAQLAQFIAGLPVFQQNGQFSAERYKQLLASQNLSPIQFEEKLRRDLAVAPLQEPVAVANIVARASSERYVGLLEQKREIAVATVDAEPFAKDVSIDDAAVKSFYETNPQAFKTPEQLRFEYVLLTQDSLMPSVSVDAAEVRQYYEANAKQYGQEEQRSAAHILIAVKPDASDADKAAAKKKADDIAAQAKANPAKFAELAKQYSEDPGSAPQGGELGALPRGSLEKNFEDAEWKLKVGEIAGPVLTDFGWHVIKLTGITPAKMRPFDEVKAQIETDLKRQKVTQKFASAADQLQNLVYEQADSLQPAAKALGLPLQTSQSVTRAEAQAIALGNPKFVEALFSPEAIQSKRNTDAMEVGPNALMAGRVIEHKAAAPRPFDDVKDDIRRQLVQRAASEMAQKAGREKLARLASGASDKDARVTFAAPVTLVRTQSQPGIPPDAVTRVFQLDPTKLPGYVGLPNERGGFSIYKLTKVVDAPPPDDGKVAQASARIGDQLGRELFTAYVGALKAKTDVKINQANLEKK
jgi:peptidyl-prolyl cis-trans isomerase D